MGNVFRILKRDFKRLLKAPAAMVVVIALLVLPSIYTWYNVVAFWNPYEATGNLRVSVVNQDAGTTTDMTGKLDVGDKLVEELMANDQLAWQVDDDYDAAIESLKAGDVYAVYVIPEDFSACLVSPLTGGVKSPHIDYYANEKLGPVSPKITDTAASTLAQQINSTFVATVAEAATDAIDSAVAGAQGDAASAKGGLVRRMNDVKGTLDTVRTELSGLQKAVDDARKKMADADTAISDGSVVFDDAKTILQDVENEALALKATLADISKKLTPGKSGLPQKLGELAEKASGVADDVAQVASKADSDIEVVIARIEPIAEALQEVATDLQAIADAYPRPGPIKDALERAAAQAQERADMAQGVLDELTQVAGGLALVAQQAEQTSIELDKMAYKVPDAIIRFEEDLYGTAASVVDSETAQIVAACESISSAISSMEASIGQARPLIGQLDAMLADFSKAIAQTDTLIGDTGTDLDSLMTDMGIMAGSSALSDVLGNGTLNAQRISEFMGAPTELSTTKFYEMNAYGTSMSPLFLNLTFWIGAFMLVIIFLLEVDSEGIEGLKPWQRYMGRFLMFAIFSALQSIICCAGTLALGVQAAEPVAMFVSGVVTAVAYLSLIYMLSSLFRHVGKALCIVLVFAQIPGGSGLYPLELTSSFFQGIYPFLPFSYGINAMREALGGFYGDYFVHDLMMLGLLLVSCLIIGMLVGPLMSNVTRMTARQVHAGDLYNGEEVLTPERPYRSTQVLRALTEKETYRAEVEKGYERFSRWYPRFIRASIIVGVGVPVLLCLLLALDTGEKATLLTLFLFWLIALIAFLVIVESRRSSFERQMNLEDMSDARLLNLFSQRNRMIRSGLRITSRRGGKGDGDSEAESGEAGEAEDTDAAGDEGEEAVAAAAAGDEGEKAATAAADGRKKAADAADGRGESAAAGGAANGLRNIGLVFRRDASGLFKNVMSVVITVGLVVLPSLFAWYNILACWNVFGNTGNLSVAVANEDEGYKSDLLPIDVNVGEKMISALHENDQINWVFTDAEDAVEGTKAGTYYAALVVPEGFSKDLLTFYDGDSVSAKIDYYVNDKKNAIAPNITGIGADTVSYEVNATFADTLSKVAAGLGESLLTIAEKSDAAGFVASLSSGTRTVADRLGQSVDIVGLYSTLSKDAQGLLQGSASALDTLSSQMDDLFTKIEAGKERLRELIADVVSSVEEIQTTLDNAKQVVTNLEGKADALIENAEIDVAEISGQLREKAADIDAEVAKIDKVVKILEKLKKDLQSGITNEISAKYPSSGGGLTIDPNVDVDIELSRETTVMVEDTLIIDKAISVLKKAEGLLEDASAACTKTADELDEGTKDVRNQLKDLKKRAAQVRAELEEAKQEIEQNLGPGVAILKADIEALEANLDQGAARLQALAAGLPGTVRTVADAFGDISTKLDAAGTKLGAASKRLLDLANAIDLALASGDMETVKSLLQEDPATLAAALSAPVQVNRTALFPCENFGSAMAPLYCTLAMFIGSLLIMVAMRVEVSRRGRERLRNPKPRHLYFGRFGVVALLSLAQTTLLALGCMLFLKVQVAEPLLFMVGFWISGLVFAFIIYTLVVAFGNLGKAIAVLLLIIQVTACNGSYPLPILPDFVSAISPWVPATYIVDALRAAMMGVYMNDFWIAIGHLLLFVIPFLLLGLVLRKPLERFMKFYVSKVEECKIME